MWTKIALLFAVGLLFFLPFLIALLKTSKKNERLNERIADNHNDLCDVGNSKMYL